MEEVIKLLNDIISCLAPITAFVFISCMCLLSYFLIKFFSKYSLVKNDNKQKENKDE